MAEMFRLKVNGDRRVVLPDRLISRLHITPGDELCILIDNDNSLSISFAKGSEAYAPSNEDLEELQSREQHMAGKKEFTRAFKRVRTRRTLGQIAHG